MKKTKSPLQKALDKYEYLFDNWNKYYSNNSCTEEYSYTKEKLKIVFQEELREHIVNLSVIHPSKKYIRVYFRKCLNFSDELCVEELIHNLENLGNSNNVEDQEINIYIDFLIKNNLL